MRYYYHKKIPPYLEHYIIAHDDKPVVLYINQNENINKPKDWVVVKTTKASSIPKTAKEITKEEFESNIYSWRCYDILEIYYQR